MNKRDLHKIRALVIDFNKRSEAALAHRDRGGGHYYVGSANAYDYAAKELRALLAEMGEGDGPSND